MAQAGWRAATAEYLAEHGITRPILHLDLPGIRHAILARFPHLAAVATNPG